MDVEACTPVAVDVTFLRMDRPPEQAGPPLPPAATMQQAMHCSVGFYRYLYHTVGQRHVWWLRRTLPDAELAEILGDPDVAVHVLYRDGEPAGFYELDRRNWPAVNLAYFGLLPHVVGSGLGRALLGQAIADAWMPGARVLTVNTCTADHPRALPNYFAAGFHRLRTVREVWRVPMRLGLPIPDRLRLG